MANEFIKQWEKDIQSPCFGLADKMLELMSDGKTRYVDQIADILEVSFMDALEVFQFLHKEGKLYQNAKKGNIRCL